jgi:hypothetical protein
MSGAYKRLLDDIAGVLMFVEYKIEQRGRGRQHAHPARRARSQLTPHPAQTRSMEAPDLMVGFCE